MLNLKNKDLWQEWRHTTPKKWGKYSSTEEIALSMYFRLQLRQRVVLNFVTFDNFTQLSSFTSIIFSNSTAVSVFGRSNTKTKQGIETAEVVEGVDSILLLCCFPKPSFFSEISLLKVCQFLKRLLKTLVSCSEFFSGFVWNSTCFLKQVAHFFGLVPPDLTWRVERIPACKLFSYEINNEY